ncbi:hypothetical protein COS31_03860 [Candidatus Roizmanbacteria bacterium CG02_land_8_20_14_3_00_36_15]|uniref:Glycogen debranching enzyme C-terminal domain-containing protein n=2 Tax=Candidatus Roizmaniibacteriota TaxID=1752723 RepID=A0A2M8KKK5_9BACT|nr:MAG: hypothetical protein COS51_02685 [Candidatus Roizmanbacteria bacterium CG03_land_8_20_14_0_80_36_21]PIV37542.1 MAG: hypothetical protein COS31_03860 [Candidatus Roizmanbacteria bacterium CG02_land_8_20_14_3_00_36_15]PIY70432.1 MAG: hypothetical protein COY89_01320 [Candidatus Roizmanbacteria bacterium CG_4_10_14_0_8_um_filter_36_36]PJA53823.1 MAG: hypothetical protein CO166_00415 [Candidatus Roizmanbacteria bacterium CG_4_9_14_3_um_filter_36_11]PJC81321.1 MAG: hypothetical protein CO007
MSEENPVYIASAGLDRCARSIGYAACGKKEGHFDQGVWLRDAVWGGLGSLSTADEKKLQTVRASLNFFLDQSPLIPYRSMSYIHALYMLSHAKLKIPAHLEKDRTIPLAKILLNPDILAGKSQHMADNFLILMLAGNYLSSQNVSNDEKKEFWQAHQNHLKDFFRSYLDEFVNDSTSLITEAALSTRQDSICKSGNVLLTNVLWYKTLLDLRDGVIVAGNDEWSKQLIAMTNILKNNINKLFWPQLDETRSHYLDWVDEKGERYDYFDSLANFWAIVTGIADQARAEKILAEVSNGNMRFGQYQLVETVNHPGYPDRLIDRGLRILRFSQWYNSGDKGIFWPEVSILFAAALKKTGKELEAKEALGKIEDLIIRHKGLHEIYFADGTPGRGGVFNGYRAPFNFTMALGTYLWVKANWENL